MRSFPYLGVLISLLVACEDGSKADSGGADGGADGAADGGADGAADGGAGDGGGDGGGPVDADGDGATDDVDCDDANPDVYPGAPEICDGLDNDCNDAIDDDLSGAPTWYGDADEDGFGDDSSTIVSCAAPEGSVGVGGDCDDADPMAFPGAPEVCDDIDSDCDGSLDDPESTDAVTFYPDEDDDGYGNDAVPVVACMAPTNHVEAGGDCDDGDERVSPEATEVCDGRDTDCDGLVDDADDSLDASTLSEFFADGDADGYGDPGLSTLACAAAPGTVTDDSDCDDSDPGVNPAAVDVPQDTIDQDCDGRDAPYLLADLVVGDLVITEFMQNPAVVPDEDGEWFEVFNSAGGEVDLDGLYIYDLGGEGHTVVGPVLVGAGEYAVFARNGNPVVNGGVAAAYDFPSTINLSNSGDEIGLADSSALGVVFDVIMWDNGVTFPDGNGVSANLDPAAQNPTDNDVGANWCLTPTATFGAGDKGTPGEANESCPS